MLSRRPKLNRATHQTTAASDDVRPTKRTDHNQTRSPHTASHQTGSQSPPHTNRSGRRSETISSYFQRHPPSAGRPVKTGWRVVAYLAFCCSLFGIVPTLHAQSLTMRTGDVIAQRQFVQQLTERRLFALARQQTQHLLQQASSAEAAAIWQLQMAQIYRQHAWYLRGRSRTELLKQSLADMADFLNERVPPVEYNLQIRLEIARTLAHSVQMSLPAAQAGHLFGKRSDNVGRSSGPEHSAAVDRASRMTEAAMVHLEQHRADMEADFATRLRDDGRFLQAQIASLNWRLTQDPGARAAAADQATERWSQVQRTSRNSRYEIQAALQLAELSLTEERSRGFQMKMRAVNDRGTERPFGRPAFVLIRRQLFERNPEAALRLAQEATVVTDLQQQHLQWLILESLLGLTDAALQLSDDQLQQRAAERFERQLAVVSKTCEGAFAEAVDRTADRFELLMQVGPEVADLMEQIDALEAAGQIDDALRQIDVALQRLPPQESSLARGALNFKAGQLLTGQQQFSEAGERFSTAVTIFQTVDLPARAASADLLRIFCIARQLNSDRSGPDIVAYRDALRQHLQRFRQQETTDQAAAWLQKLLNSTNPPAAARLALQRYEQPDSEAGFQHLAVCGRLLIRLRFDASTVESVSHASRPLEDQFMVHWSKQQETRNVLSPDLASALLSGLLLHLTREPGTQDWKSWQTLLEAVQPWQTELKSSPVDAMVWPVSSLIVAARTNAPTTQQQKLKAELLQLDARQQRMALSALGEQLQGTIRGGNSLLTTLAAKLLADYLQHDASRADAANGSAAERGQASLIIPVAARIAVFTDQPDILQRVLAKWEQTEDEAAATNLQQALSRHTELIAARPTVSAVVLRYWQQVLNRTTQGSDRWLEASLQQASLRFATGAQQQAARQLQLVQTLYPGWGQPDRQQKAQNLLQKINRK